MADTFRKAYKQLPELHSQLILDCKNKAEELEDLMRQIYKSREMSLAITNLEQSLMWCTKAIVLDAEKED